MTCQELAQLISRRVVIRAQEEPDPMEYFCRAIAEIQVLEEFARKGHIPPERIEGELLEWGRKFGLLVQGIEKE